MDQSNQELNKDITILDDFNVDATAPTNIEDRIDALETSMKEHTHSSTDSTTPLTDTSFVVYNLPDTDAKFGNYQTHFFTATRPCIVKNVSMAYITAAGFSATGHIERLTSGTAPGAGTRITLSGVDLNKSTNTPYRSTLKDQTSLNVGDRLGFVISGSPTNLNTLTITIELAV